MNYHISRNVDGAFEDVVARAIEALKSEGFGVLTQIDVAATLKAKLGKDFRPYKILGACNPGLALEALSAEAHVGLLMPCNVVVQAHEGGKVEVSAVDATATLALAGVAAIDAVAKTVRDKLARVVAGL